MCGRFALFTLDGFLARFPWVDRGDTDFVPPGYNVAPSDGVPVVVGGERPALRTLRWGLVPPWAGDPAIGNRLINARAETLATKPSFRQALKRRRCAVPADGFFEWKKHAGGRTPYYLRRTDGRPLALAGLWESWRDPAGGPALDTFTVITCPPNALLATLHDRMPVVLPDDRLRDWLRPGDMVPAEAADLLVPCPAEAMEARRVSAAVNSPANDGPALIEPAAEADDPAPPPTLFD